MKVCSHWTPKESSLPPAQGAGEAGVGDGAVEAGQADDVLARHGHRVHQDGEAYWAHHL